MILTALEMQGFKSFPEKTALTFGKGITAVVGPNGSGKSNISDAVRWVLGEQSSKSLRGSKMEDVIFDGTKIRKAHGFAQVTLYLDNKDRSVKGVDTDEISVTRRYYRSGESEYKINGKNVRLRDVHELFMDTGLGRDGYSMVSQGKIADMVSGKAKECREMFEEAAGISAYRYRRGDALKRLSQAEENLVRLRDILAELQGRIGPLKHQSDKAQKFLVLAEEKKILEIGLWLYNIEKLKEELRKHEDNLIIATTHYEETEQVLREIEEKIESCLAQTQNINIQIDDIRRNISLLEEQAASSGSDIAVLKNSIDHNNETIERIGRDRDDSLSGRQQLQSEIDTEEKLIAQIRAIEAEKTAELETLSGTLSEISGEAEELSRRTGEITEEISSANSELAESRILQSTYNSTITEIQERMGSIDAVVLQRRGGIITLEAESKKYQGLLADCAEAIGEATNSISGYTMMLKTKTEFSDKTKADLDRVTFEAQRVSSRVKMLTELEKNMEGYSGAVKKVIAQSKKGGLDGIHGTVSNIISVNSDYAVAIETALGNAVQNIVTDTPETAKAAIEYLKKQGHGRATFLPVSSVKGRDFREDALEDCFGYIDVAVNLVNFDPKYENIMSSLLGKIVVAEDLTSAIAIAKKFDYSFKIVTLDGQIINAGGSMTGGSASKTAGILSRSTEIEDLKKTLAGLESKITQLNESYKKVTGEIEGLNKECDKVRNKFVDLQQEKIRLESHLTLLDEQLTSIKDAIGELESEKATANEKIEQAQQSYNEAVAKTKVLSAKITEFEEQLLELDRSKVQLSQKEGEMSKKISELRLEIHGAQRDLQARVQALNLLKARLVSNEDRDRELESEIEAIKQKNIELQTQIEELKNLCSTLHEKVEAAKKQIRDLQYKRNEVEELSVTLRTAERNKTSEREKIGGEVARIQERKATIEKEYDDTLTKLYDEYLITKSEAQAIGEIPEEP